MDGRYIAGSRGGEAGGGDEVTCGLCREGESGGQGPRSQSQIGGGKCFPACLERQLLAAMALLEEAREEVRSLHDKEGLQKQPPRRPV